MLDNFARSRRGTLCPTWGIPDGVMLHKTRRHLTPSDGATFVTAGRISRTALSAVAASKGFKCDSVAPSFADRASLNDFWWLSVNVAPNSTKKRNEAVST